MLELVGAPNLAADLAALATGGRVMVLGVPVPVDATYPLDQAPAAYGRFAAGAKLGKIVLVTGAG